MSKIAGNFYELTSLFYKFIENELCRNFDRFICTETDSSQNCHFQGKRCNPLDSGRWVDCCEFFHLLRRHSAEMFDNALVNCTHAVWIYFSCVNLLAQLFYLIEENKNDRYLRFNKFISLKKTLIQHIYPAFICPMPTTPTTILGWGEGRIVGEGPTRPPLKK